MTSVQDIDHYESVAARMIDSFTEFKNADAHLVAASTTNSIDMEKLKTMNAKLNIQLGHLQKNLEIERNRQTESMMSLIKCLSDLFEFSIRHAFPQVKEPKLLIVSSPKFADYQCNSAMSLCQALNKLDGGKKVNPRQVAEEIIRNLPENNVIEKAEVAGPGFINIFLSKSFVINRLLMLIRSGHVTPPDVGPKKRVIVDMSSPNIAKEMHVGHLRSTIIGESIARLCQFVGHDVKKLNHIGDWGTQFGMLIAHLKDSYPDFTTRLPPIQDLQAFYKESKKRFDDDEEFKKRAYQSVVLLQSRDEQHICGWKQICDISRREFEKIYDRLGIRNLEERGESFYQSLMLDCVKSLEEQELLEEDEKRKVMFADGCQIPLTVVKSDGGFTYDTSDLTALQQRLKDEKADWIIYVVDAGQSVHLETVFACARLRCKWFHAEKTRVEHVAFGLVLGEDKKKLKTRSGESIRLVDLLNEGVKRSEAKLIEKGRDKELSAEEFARARDAVAYGCIKYADLAHNRINDYVFSFDKMLDDKGNTAVYLLYAYMRIRAISRNAGITFEELQKHSRSMNSIEFQNAKEMKLVKSILKFPDIIMQAVLDWGLHSLCEYIYDLSSVFTDFYGECYCIEKDPATGKVIKVNIERLMLAEATAMIMKAGFDILGIQTIARI